MRSPLEIVADSAHEYSDTLPKTSQDRALLFSRRHGFAEAAIKALLSHGWVIVPRQMVDDLTIEADNPPWLTAP